MRMVVNRVGQWAQADELLGARARVRVQRSLMLGVRKEAELARSLLIEGIRKQAPGGKKFAPLRPSTLKKRRLTGFRGRKALIVRGDLINSIVTRHGALGSFVGVLRTAKARDGKSLVNVMMIQEQGRTIVIPVTPGVQRFLGFMLRNKGRRRVARKSPRGIIIVKIPARPVFAPVWEKHFSGTQSAKRIEGRVSKDLAGRYGFTAG